jgi:hypothetical protein
MKIIIDTDERYPDYYWEIATEKNTMYPSFEVPIDTLEKWKKAIDNYNLVQNEMQIYYRSSE